jgi:hypothetical protein
MNARRWLVPVVVSLVLLTPGAALAANALIVHDGTAGLEAAVVANLTAKLTAASYTVTPNVGVPGGSLAGYTQVWDVRFNNTTPLSAGDITAYVGYLAGGGALAVNGENPGFAVRNTSIVALITAAGGGAVTLTTPTNLETVLSPFTGPNAVGSVTYQAAAGIPSPPGTGSCITKDASNIAAAVVWQPGTLGNALAGTLITVFDINMMDVGAAADLQALLANMLAYLDAPPPPMGQVPALSLAALLALGAALAAVALRSLSIRAA